MCVCVCVHIRLPIIVKKEVMNLKEIKEGLIEEFEGRKEDRNLIQL